MKNAISILLSLVFLLVCPVRSQWAGVLAGSPPSGQAAAYFGNCNSDGSPLAGYGFDFFGTFTFFNNNSVVAFTCPGTGTRTVDSLGVYAKNRGSPANVRLAVYDTSLNLIFQGSAAISVSSGTEQWWSHTTFSGTAQLTGGTNYVIAYTDSGALVSFAFTTQTGGSQYVVADYTGGFPDPIGAGTNNNYGLAMRCHVQ